MGTSCTTRWARFARPIIAVILFTACCLSLSLAIDGGVSATKIHPPASPEPGLQFKICVLKLLLKCGYTGCMTAQYVEAEINLFQDKFRQLKSNTKRSLKKHNISVEDVADALTSLPADDVAEHKQFLESHVTALFKAENHSELFGIVNLYWNYLNYPLLDHLIQVFDLKEVKGEMEVYKKDLQKFRKKTPLTLFCKTQKKRHIKPPSEFAEMVMVFEWPDDVTLEIVEQFRQEYACHYGLRECAMMLAAVRPHCFIITWFIPESIVEKLKEKVPRAILKKYTVTRLEITGTCVYRLRKQQQQV